MRLVQLKDISESKGLTTELATGTIDDLKELVSNLLGQRIHFSEFLKSPSRGRVLIKVYTIVDHGRLPMFRREDHAEIDLDLMGKIVEVRGMRTEAAKKVTDFRIDFSLLKDYKRKIMASQTSLTRETQVLGSYNTSGEGRFYDTDDILTPPTINTVEVNGCDQDVNNIDLVEVYKAIAKSYRGSVTSTISAENNGTEWRFTFSSGGFDFRVRLWLFFDYHLSVCVSKKGSWDTPSLNLSEKKMDGARIMKLVNELASGTASDLARALMAVDKGDSDVRGYRITETGDGIEIEIKYSRHYYKREPDSAYLFRLSPAKGTVECIAGRKNIRFIPNEVERFRRRLVDVNAMIR